VDRFVKPDEKEDRDLQRLRNLLDDLAVIENNADFHAMVEPAVIKSHLKSRLAQNRYGSDFLKGNVTFCAMLPMRSIPFKIICLVGLNNDAYPRDFQPLNFDLMARHPQAGDRSRRNDDKYLFLESIISARSTLYISYVGQSIQDNSILPPSVLVSELLDTIKKSFAVSIPDLHERIAVRHRLQPFSPGYFHGGTGLFSYSSENMLAGFAEKTEPLPFVADPIPLSSDEAAEWQQLDLDALCRFFSNPSRFFIQRRLGIILEDKSSLSEDRENFVLATLEKFQIEQNLLQARMAGSDLIDFKPVQKALGQLPHGHVGDVHYSKMSIEVEDFVSKIARFTSQAPRKPVEIDLNLSGLNLKGQVSHIAEDGWINIRYARKNVKNILASWIYHLALCHQAPTEYPRTSFLICKDSAMRFGPVTEVKALLEGLVNLYRQGLEQPIHFFPDTSHEYADYKLNRSVSGQGALEKAGLKWRGVDSPRKYNRIESDDPYYDLCFRRLDPLDETFTKTALAVFEPLFGHSEEIIL
jgi:exodeoxyribonuclease V gamma subunit